MKYRKAELFDVDVLSQTRVDMLCEETAYSEQFQTLLFNNTKQYIADGIKSNSVVLWVAEQDEKTIAMGCVNFFTIPPNDWCPNGKTAYIGNMFTIPTFRKQGIASHILSLLINEAKTRGCQRIVLNTTDMGRPLYEKYGFGVSPTAMAYFPFGIMPTL